MKSLKLLKLFLKLIKTLEKGRIFALESLTQNSPQMGFYNPFKKIAVGSNYGQI